MKRNKPKPETAKGKLKSKGLYRRHNTSAIEYNAEYSYRAEISHIELTVPKPITVSITIDKQVDCGLLQTLDVLATRIETFLGSTSIRRDKIFFFR